MNKPTTIPSIQAASTTLAVSEVLGAKASGETMRAAIAEIAPKSAGVSLPTTSQGERGPARAGGNKGTLKLWELHHKFHCPIIGTCLHADELRQMKQKVDGSPAGSSVSDYQVHVTFVGAAETKNHLSVAVQKRLTRKFASSIRQFAAAKAPEAVAELWRAAVARGEVPGAFWALMSHPRADQRVRTLAYEDVHMMSHQIGAGQYTDARVLTETRAQLAALERARAQEARRHEQRLAARDRLLVAHKEQLARANASLRRLKQQAKDSGGAGNRGATAAPEDARAAELEAENKRLRSSYERATREAQRLRQEREAAAERIRELSVELTEQQAANAALERILADQQALGEAVAECTGRADCRACLDLQGRRILCIGGRGTLADHYRELVARCNGELVRHDGGLEDSDRRLEAMMASADAIVCPADFVSHNAYYRAKRFCKRYAKPCILLRSSGISSFAKALEQLAA